MPKDICLTDKTYTFQEFVRVLARAISSINADDPDAVFSITDLIYLLRSVNTYVPGEFDLQRTHSDYYKIVYIPEDELIESFKERWEGLLGE